MEMLVDMNETDDPLPVQRTKLVALSERYNEAMAQLTIEDRQANAHLIEQLTKRVTTICEQLANALQIVQRNRANGENSAPREIVEESDSQRETESPIDFGLDDPMELELPGENANSESDVNTSETPTVNKDEVTSQENTTAPSQTAQQQSDAAKVPIVALTNNEANVNAQSNVNEPSKVIKPPAHSPSIANQRAIETQQPSEMLCRMISDQEFSYQSLIHSNMIYNGLVTLAPMPLKANQSHFRELRLFIAKIMRMCAEHQLNLGNVELMLMTNVIAAFNEEVFSNWRSQTVTGRSSLRSIVTFLTIQEDMARDRWFMESRFVLASAVKAAQEKLLGKRENSLALPSEAKKPVPLNQSETTNRNQKGPTYSRL